MTKDTGASRSRLSGEEGCMTCPWLRERMRQARETLDRTKVASAMAEAREHLAEAHWKAVAHD
ncbi:hypothetical protein [Streptomyces cinnamoneus]|nr:hypothetical protein [Streptomyces cinnamoneus]